MDTVLTGEVNEVLPLKDSFEIPYYHRYFSAEIAKKLQADATPLQAIEGLQEVGPGGGLESAESLKTLIEIYRELKTDLNSVLEQRTIDRKFIDLRTAACYKFNSKVDQKVSNTNYRTVIGLEDANGRIVIGPKTEKFATAGGIAVTPIPDFLQGSQVTLFGPPDSKKMAINAMNAYHRKLPQEPPVIEELLKSHDGVPKWGADDEDSKTPLRQDLIEAGINLTACFNRDIKIENNSKYQLAGEKLSLPIKRIPGIALPSSFLFFKGSPIPLHMYDFVLHMLSNWQNPQALIFYIPKLENEEEARYIHKLVARTEQKIQEKHPSYQIGSVRLMIVLENPRAILRVHEIIDELSPYFVGASLGWHDYLASTARVFKEDGNYRIPVKADPDIVVKYIKASHMMLKEVVGSRGGIKVGGMYGILPLDDETTSASFQITLRGFFVDVITQLKRGLDGFWVAHPDFVRLGMALVEAWKQHENGQPKNLKKLTEELLLAPYCGEILKLIEQEDISGLDKQDPGFVRSLLVADIEESDFISNSDPIEIRYNIFQSLQYLTDWLCGNGCVALPAIVLDTPVRVMDDLATAERSRWEVWHEIRHGRFSVEDFLRIVHEELHFIRKDLSDKKKIVQVKWNEDTAKWYPVATRIMLKLMTDPDPVEFATELLMPFTAPYLRGSASPLEEIEKTDAVKYQLPTYIEKFNYYFEVCGSQKFATEMAALPIFNLEDCRNSIIDLNNDELNRATSFHGNIGENRSTLDSRAASEQAKVLSQGTSLQEELLALGNEYRKKFGFKFMISAKGKTGEEILDTLKQRIQREQAVEFEAAKKALLEISEKRLVETPPDDIQLQIASLQECYQITGASISLICDGIIQPLSIGHSQKDGPTVDADTRFQIASLSKTLASAFTIEYFKTQKIELTESVNSILKKAGSPFRISSQQEQNTCDLVTVEHLLSHTALNMHYVSGIPGNQTFPEISHLLAANNEYGYPNVETLGHPGLKFSYSGAGFLILQHIVELLENKPIGQIIRPWLDSLGLSNTSFADAKTATGYLDDGSEAPHLDFPAFAAGLSSTSTDIANFLQILSQSYQDLNPEVGLSHDTAVKMLHGKDLGSIKFIGAKVGLGTFIAEAGANRLVIHQGANEGYRSLYIHCFSGPDSGKGLVTLCNGDNKAVLFNARLAQIILMHFEFDGIDFSKLSSNFDFNNIPQEQIVNLGYKKLIFDYFKEDLPEPISRTMSADPLSDYNLCVDAKLQCVSNQKFARACNALSAFPPEFDPNLFGKQGKIMDSWESARHTEGEYDFIDFSIKQSSSIRYVSFSTQFHDGNQAEYIQILGRTNDSDEWREIFPKTKAKGHSLLQVKLNKPVEAIKQIRTMMYPDGGLTRIGLYTELPPSEQNHFKETPEAQWIRFSDEIPKTQRPLALKFVAGMQEIQKNNQRPDPIDFASASAGASVTMASDEHFGPASQVISPFPALDMFDGFESSRSRNPDNFETLEITFIRAILVAKVIFDFEFFKNNNPKAVQIWGLKKDSCHEISKILPTKAYAGNKLQILVPNAELFQKIKIHVYPDGGINRISVFEH